MRRSLSRTKRLSKIKLLLERNPRSRTEALHDFLSKLTKETKRARGSGGRKSGDGGFEI